MKEEKNLKRALVLSVLSLLVCLILLVGTTFAWFTDSVTSSGNKIQSGTLKVDLELMDKESGVWRSLKNDKTALFTNELWEPGYTEVKILKIENEGTLALKWVAKFVSKDSLSKLANVIDVYVLPYGVLENDADVAYPSNRELEGYTKVGTLSEFVNTIEETTKGILKKGESAYLGIALKMQESAGNEYQGLDLGGVFDIQIVATQNTTESDSFDNQYDVNAPLDFMPVSNFNELKSALAVQAEKILFLNDISINGPIVVDYDAYIDGAGHTIVRQANAVRAVAEVDGEATTVYTGEVFNVGENATLTLTNITVDGGAVWTGDINPVLKRGTINAGVQASSSLIVAQKNSHIVLGENSVIQNNSGVVAINLSTRIGATLTVDGGQIINNHSDCGAIWGGGHITIKSGSVNYNSSTGIAGAIRMVSDCNLTMTGGEICNNVAVTQGGAVYGYGASVYTLSGGKISGNKAGVGGAFYTGNSSSVIISGDFELSNNIADTNGGALRLSNYTSIKMTGGKIYGNDCLCCEKEDCFYGWNPGVTISGGELQDSILIQGGLTPTVGGDGITGIIYFDLGTTHNTVNLSTSFGLIHFTVATDDNFGAFNFKPVSSYVYTQGDEDKLVCMNEGYVTYWDASTGTFRLQANA